MKKSILSLGAMLFVAGSMLGSCSSPEAKVENADAKVQDAKENVQDAQQDLAQAKQTSESEFQKFKNEANSEITANEGRIASLRIDMKNEKKEARERDEKKIDALEKKNRELKVKLDNYKDDGKTDWQVFKTEFKHDLDGLGKAFKDIGVKNTK